MEATDRLPIEVRRVIQEASWDPRIKVVDNAVNDVGETVAVVQYLDYSQFALKMLDKGFPVDQIVNHIRNLDAISTRVERQNGNLPPEGKAT